MADRRAELSVAQTAAYWVALWDALKAGPMADSKVGHSELRKVVL